MAGQWEWRDPGKLLPYYSAHTVGIQTNFILPANNLSFHFKYEDEFSAKVRPEGRLITFGGNWTLRIPKPQTQRNAGR